MYSVGVVIVRNGEIVDRFYSLVHPEPDYYLYWNTCTSRIDTGRYGQCSCFFGSMEAGCP